MSGTFSSREVTAVHVAATAYLVWLTVTILLMRPPRPASPDVPGTAGPPSALHAAASGDVVLHASTEAVQELLFHRMRMGDRNAAVVSARLVMGLCVLHDVDLEIAPGERVALVGSSGSGKSTLALLVPRLYDVQSGTVRIDGVDVRDLSLSSLRRQVGVVFEESLKRVFPDRPIIDLTDDHPIFHVLYDLPEMTKVVIPHASVMWGGRMGRGPPRWRGVEDEDGRLMVLIAYNNDVQDAWQWADDPRYPGELVNLALRLGANVAMYAMTH